jgi:hypothetical protein
VAMAPGVTPRVSRRTATMPTPMLIPRALTGISAGTRSGPGCTAVAPPMRSWTPAVAVVEAAMHCPTQPVTAAW